MSLASISINLPALRHNFQQVKMVTHDRGVIAMVKANAYGHSIEHITTALHDTEAFGVASIGEGILIRAAGIIKPIFLMQGILDKEELQEAIHQKFGLVIHHASQVELLKNCKHNDPISIWLKIDTGMNRLGFDPLEALAVYEKLLACPVVKKPIGLMTHFAEADNLAGSMTKKQLEIFHAATKQLPGPRSIANSAGILGWPDSHADYVRPGIILYGVSPFANTCGQDFNLQPVMSLSTHLIAIQKVRKNEAIGYGCGWIAPQDMLVGVAGLGYADGYPQFAKSGTPANVSGTLCPLVGRVSMDMLTVDLSQHPNPQIGDNVTLWGNDLPIERIAQHCETSPYELLCRVTTRARVKVVSIKAVTPEAA
ncbi:MAG TPA: alanine racemase [Gammaproteobacteria bacterium]|nr:alanine racemase [Gammaproteobacteria bacterium]